MSKRSWLPFIPLIILVVLVASFALALKRSATEAPKFAQHLNEAAPATTLPLLHNSSTVFSTQDWIGRPYIVNFFASWCVPCRSEHEYLLKLAENGIPIIGIAYEDKAQAVNAFLSQEGDPYRAIADDGTGHSGIDWALTGVPETFIVDAKGVIRYHAAGPLTEKMVDGELLPVWSEVKK